MASGDVHADGAELQLTLGGVVKLDASTSTDPDAQALSYEWTLTSRPQGSTAAFAGGDQAILEWTPDALGAYTFTLKVSDSEGASATQSLTVNVNNRAPVSSLVVTPQFTAVPTVAPTQAVTVGAAIVINATNSMDPDGNAVSVSFSLAEQPAGSQASLTVTNKTARFTADVLGLFKVRVLGSDGKGGSFESVYTFNANNRVPNPVVASDVTAVVADGGSNVVLASVGYDVVLSGAASTDPDGNTLSRAWRLESKPAGSGVALSSTTGTSTALSPDVLGDFVVVLTVTDSAGAKSEYTTTVRINNRRPQATIGTNATPQSLPSAPSVIVPPGTTLTLRGSLSADADGDTLSYLWTLQSRPAGSLAVLSSTTAADSVFTADVEGAYVFRLKVTDSLGAFSERTITVNAGTHAPVALVNKTRVSLLANATVQLSGALSFDEDGDAITYAWSLDAKPASSTASVTNVTTEALSFTPDVAGTYVIALTVRDANQASVAYVTVKALAQVTTSMALAFAPDDAKYSRGLDKLVMVSTNPNAVRIVDPFAGALMNVPLPLAVRNFSLSPDGKLAAVLHDSLVSLVDLQTATLIRTSATHGTQTDVFVTNDGVIFLIGEAGGQWVDEAVVTVNGYTGEKLPQTNTFWSFYGTQYGIFADRLNRVFLMEQGLSPSDISFFDFDPATNMVTGTGDSPYHGDYSMSVPLFLTEQQDLVFTSQGDFYRTDTLRYAGTLSGVNYTNSLSHFASSEELLALDEGANYPSSYKRFTGSLLLPDGGLPFPVLSGQQSYGIKIFHSASGAHVMLVQTGSSTPLDAGVHYHVVVR